MAGILDKKERIIDYKITNNGRSQIQNGDIRYVYATFSDSSIVYNSLLKDSIDSKQSISDESQYLSFEVTSKVNDELNPEFDLKNFATDKENGFYLNDTSVSNITLEDAIIKIKDENTKNNNVSLSKKLQNLKFLDTLQESEIKDIAFSNQEDIESNNNFNFSTSENLYPTVYNIIQEYSELPTLIADKRLSNKSSFKKLIPENIENVPLYSESSSERYFSNQVDEFFLLREYNEIVDTINEEDGYQDAILKSVNKLINNPKVIKKVYDLKDFNKKDTFIFSMYEYDKKIQGNDNNGNDERFYINKLSFIDLGKIFDKNNGKEKRVFLIGKIIKTREENNIDIDLVYSFNKGKIQKNTNKNQIPLSIYYSFINMFILFVE